MDDLGVLLSLRRLFNRHKDVPSDIAVAVRGLMNNSSAAWRGRISRNIENCHGLRSTLQTSTPSSVLHGTDAIEETTFVVNLRRNDVAPVIFTNAQQFTITEPPDGPGRPDRRASLPQI